MEVFLILPKLNEDFLICSYLIEVVKIYPHDSNFIQV